jgi:Cu/Ag efflux protein CusF
MIFRISAIVGLLLVLGIAAMAQPGQGRMGMGLGMGPGQGMENARIVKGTLDKVSGDTASIKVEAVFVPREGPMDNPPDSVRVEFTEDTRFVTGKSRDSSLKDFNKGDAVVAITAYEDGKYTVRALMTAEVATAMRRGMGERMREFRGQSRGQGQNMGQSMGQGMGRGGQGQQWGPGAMGDRMRERTGDRPPVVAGVFEGMKGPGEVELTLKGFVLPGKDGPKVREFPEARKVTVKIGERARIFNNGKKATLRDFKRGEEVFVVITRVGRGEGGELMMLADKESAEQLRGMLAERSGEMRDRQRRRDGSRQEG